MTEASAQPVEQSEERRWAGYCGGPPRVCGDGPTEIAEASPQSVVGSILSRYEYIELRTLLKILSKY